MVIIKKAGLLTGHFWYVEQSMRSLTNQREKAGTFDIGAASKWVKKSHKGVNEWQIENA